MSLTMKTSTIKNMAVRTFTEDRKWISKQTDIVGSDGETVYRVRIFRTGNFSCECASFLNRGASLACKHVKALSAAIKFEVTLTDKATLTKRANKAKKSLVIPQQPNKSAYKAVDPFQLAQSTTRKRELGSRIQFGSDALNSM